MRIIYLLMPLAAAFSGGGGSGETDSGAPILQSCDAIGVCALPDEDGSLKCPDGMHKVAPPVRSEVYVLATEAGGTTIVGGGDTASAVQGMGFGERVSHVSTGGGASLTMLEGGPMPAVAALDAT